VSASALKGRRIPAQGATLGSRGHPIRRSEGTPQRVGLGRRPLFTNMRRSFRTPGDALTVPRALPWAGMRCPVGTPGADPVLPITATPAPTSSSHVRLFRERVPDFAKALLLCQPLRGTLIGLPFNSWHPEQPILRSRRDDLTESRRWLK